jgi:glycosyltransferase involved in cell wall biosynthesis
MFGWEFPPHISGGLGTACYGLTKALSSIDDLEILFVVPKLYGDEDKNAADLIGANDIYVKQTKIKFEDFITEDIYDSYKKSHSISTNETDLKKILKEISLIEVKSLLQPYLSPEEFEKFLKERNLESSNIKIDEHGRFFYEKDGKLIEIKNDFTSTSTITEDGKFEFTGKYGSNLMQEVINYAKVAEVIASQNDFDIIHAHDWLTYAAGISAKLASGKPLVVHVHATEFDRGGEENINTNVFALETAGMKYADKVIAVSNLTRNAVINKYGIEASKVITVYNAVEKPDINSNGYNKNLDEKVVTFLGRITYQKGPAYFINAAKKVLDKTDNVRFVMAGSGDMFRQMIKYAAKLKITDKFHFTNFLKGDDVDRMFAVSDVYVMPSISEPFGISPLEAMRSNVPVIISKQSGVAEILTNAIKVDFWDEDAIADAIYALIKYEGMSKMFKKESKTEVDNLKWENSAKEVYQIYKDILRY